MSTRTHLSTMSNPIFPNHTSWAHFCLTFRTKHLIHLLYGFLWKPFYFIYYYSIPHLSSQYLSILNLDSGESSNKVSLLSHFLATVATIPLRYRLLTRFFATFRAVIFSAPSVSFGLIDWYPACPTGNSIFFSYLTHFFLLSENVGEMYAAFLSGFDSRQQGRNYTLAHRVILRATFCEKLVPTSKFTISFNSELECGGIGEG